MCSHGALLQKGNAMSKSALGKTSTAMVAPTATLVSSHDQAGDAKIRLTTCGHRSREGPCRFVGGSAERNKSLRSSSVMAECPLGSTPFLAHEWHGMSVT